MTPATPPDLEPSHTSRPRPSPDCPQLPPTDGGIHRLLRAAIPVLMASPTGPLLGHAFQARLEARWCMTISSLSSWSCLGKRVNEEPSEARSGVVRWMRRMRSPRQNVVQLLAVLLEDPGEDRLVVPAQSTGPG